MAGVTSSGFSVMSLQDILTAIETAETTTIDPGLDLSTETPLGQLNGIFANQLASLWELAQTLYNGYNPNAAEGAQLVNLAILTGTVPNVATASQASCNLVLQSSVTVPAGSQIQVSGQPGVVFQLVSDVTSTTSGTYVGLFTCTTLGPVPAAAGTLTVILTPVSGWTSVTNPLDAILGNNADTDTTLRIRRSEALQSEGSGTVDALTSKLVNLAGMVNVTVVDNDTPTIDNIGTPAYAFQACIYDGPSEAVSNTLIAQTIYDNKPLGIEAYGTTFANAIDPEGNDVSIGFTRATQVPVYISYTIVTDSSFPSGGDALVKAAAVAYANTALELGSTVYALAFRYQALTVAGVLDVTSFTLDTTPSPTDTANLTFSTLQVPTLDTANITVSP